jgi:alpha-galactosidase
MRLIALILLLFPSLFAASRSYYDRDSRSWVLKNANVEARFQLTPEGNFQFLHIRAPGQEPFWRSRPDNPSCPIRIVTTEANYGCWTSYRLISHSIRPLPNGGHRQTIVLDDLDATARFTVAFDLHQNHPIIRQSIRLRSLRPFVARVTDADLLPLTLDDHGGPFETLRVNQWVHGGHTANFDLLERPLPANTEIGAYAGAAGEHCSWIVIRGEGQHGLFAGWEFNGRSFGKFIHEPARGVVDLQIPILGAGPDLGPSLDFTLPAAFFGIFEGGWGEASWQTTSYVETAIARRVTDPRFPYVMWDSWGYGQDINEATLRRNAEIAASLGIEVFTVDLGWARRIGDWHADAAKFPSGLRALSDYVHSLGMKFGLHLAFAEAHAQAPILMANPDWRATQNDNYYGADSICLAHEPARDWVLSELLRVIDEYGVDWILQDGENMVKRCNNPAHAHGPDSANYTGAVNGLDYILDTIQRERPDVLWENCENGGAMMTYAMTRRYATSIAADNAGAFPARRSLHGATYPFPARYTARYMPEEALTPGITRSYMFGGPWIFMNRLPLLNAASLALARTEINLYKDLRPYIRDARVDHLTPPPAEGAIDAIQALHLETGTAILFIHRQNSAAASTRIHPRGLDPDRAYAVRFQDTGVTLHRTGAQLMDEGVPIQFRSALDALVLRATPE